MSSLVENSRFCGGPKLTHYRTNPWAARMFFAAAGLLSAAIDRKVNGQ